LSQFLKNASPRTAQTAQTIPAISPALSLEDDSAIGVGVGVVVAPDSELPPEGGDDVADGDVFVAVGLVVMEAVSGCQQMHCYPRRRMASRPPTAPWQYWEYTDTAVGNCRIPSSEYQYVMQAVMVFSTVDDAAPVGQ